jgi:hypothetical protein
MNAQQLPTADELQALYDLPARLPRHDRARRVEAVAFWGGIAAFLVVFWTGFVIGCSALWSAVTG